MASHETISRYRHIRTNLGEIVDTGDMQVGALGFCFLGGIALRRPIMSPLTPQGERCLILSGLGEHVAAVGRYMNIGPDTVKSHLKRVFATTKRHTAAGSVAWLFEEGHFVVGQAAPASVLRLRMSELEAIYWLGQGLRQGDIGRRLGIRCATVRSNFANLRARNSLTFCTTGAVYTAALMTRQVAPHPSGWTQLSHLRADGSPIITKWRNSSGEYLFDAPAEVAMYSVGFGPSDSTDQVVPTCITNPTEGAEGS